MTQTAYAEKLRLMSDADLAIECFLRYVRVSLVRLAGQKRSMQNKRLAKCMIECRRRPNGRQIWEGMEQAAKARLAGVKRSRV